MYQRAQSPLLAPYTPTNMLADPPRTGLEGTAGAPPSRGGTTHTGGGRRSDYRPDSYKRILPKTLSPKTAASSSFANTNRVKLPVKYSPNGIT